MSHILSILILLFLRSYLLKACNLKTKNTVAQLSSIKVRMFVWRGHLLLFERLGIATTLVLNLPFSEQYLGVANVDVAVFYQVHDTDQFLLSRWHIDVWTSIEHKWLTKETL